MSISYIPVSAINTADSTDKYSDTNAIKEDRKLNEKVNETQGAGLIKSDEYLQTQVSPSDIQQTSDIPDGFDKVYNPKSGYGIPTKVTNDVGVYIQRDAPKRQLEGTIIRSINNKCSEDLYSPTIEELPWLKSKIVKDLNFAALYTGEWNPDNVMSNTGNPDPDKTQYGSKAVSTRANKILGQDALVVDETYDTTNGYKAWTLKSNNTMNLRDAITIAYKALSDNYYWIQAYPQGIGTSDIPVEKTPFAEAVGAENCSVDHSRYYTDVWISRTCPRTYYSQAVRDGVTAYDYDNREASDTKISIGDFCVIVAKLLDLNGEDVITDQEAQQLLSVYQRSIPTYVTSVQQDAIKYLMVRGIVNGDEKFKDEITADFALTILMRAKDKSSRLTFKQIDIPYDKTLLAKGFTGVDLAPSTVSPATSIQVENKMEASEYYDYFIKKTDSTTFKDVNGKEVTAMYVSSARATSGADGGSRIEGSDYIGIVDDYYHFKIPISAIQTATFESSGFPASIGKVFTITTRNSDNRPTKYFVQAGGGVYDSFTKVKFEDSEYTIALRTPFSSTDDPLLTDYERKVSKQKQMEDGTEIKLTSNSYEATIQIRNPNNTTWANTYIKDLSHDENNPTELGGAKVYVTNTNRLIVKFDNEKDPWGAISKNLSSNTMEGEDSNECFPAYIIGRETTPIVLLSLKWLQNNPNGLANRITDMPQPLADQEGKYTIETEGGPIQVDTKAKTFAIGSCYTELGANDKSPLIFQDEGNKDWYVDYRVLAGVSAGYMIFDNKDSTKSFVPTDVHDTPVDKPEMKIVKSVTGSDEDTLSVGALFQGSRMMLEGPYSKSNFMLYKLNREGLKGDYLLVFKPASPDYNDGNRAQVEQKLEKDFKIKLGSNAVCSIYNLDATVRGADDSLVHPLATRIENKPGFGYMYIVPDISGFDTNTYYNPPNDSKCPLPIVEYGGEFYDLNVNHVQGFPTNRVPAALLTSSMKARTNGNDLIFDGGFNDAGSKLTFSSNSQMTPAPIGLTACYKDEYDKSVSELASSESDETYRAVGTTGGKIEEIATSSTDYNFNICNGAYNYKIKADSKFYLAGGNSSLAENKSRGIYVYKDPDGVGITALNDLSNGEMGLMDGLKRNIFDWKLFSFLEMLKAAEDISTIIYIVLLEIIPRLFLFDFLGLATLSLIARNNFMELFCARVFDPYKIISYMDQIL